MGRSCSLWGCHQARASHQQPEGAARTLALLMPFLYITLSFSFSLMLFWGCILKADLTQWSLGMFWQFGVAASVLQAANARDLGVPSGWWPGGRGQFVLLLVF